MGDTSILSFQYTYVYAMINLFCAIIALVILSKFNSYIGNSKEVHLFRAMTTFYLIYLVLEIVWILALNGIIPFSALTTGLIKILDTMFIPIMVYVWFWFALVRFKSKRVKNKKYIFILSIPLILMFILYATSFFTGIVFKITPEKTVMPGPLFYLTGIIDNFYGIAIIIYATHHSLKEGDYQLKSDLRAHIIFIIICTVSGILDAVVSMTPIMALCIVLAIIYIFVNLSEPQINNVYKDGLTGIDNRRSADRHIEEIMEESPLTSPFYLFITDIDHFKQINDTMGHLEGDKALKTVAGAVVEVADEFHGFAARWGGDEFIVIIPNIKEETLPSRFSEALDKKLQHYTKRYRFPYQLSMTIGYAFCESSDDDIASIIDTADKMLYQNRQERLLK